MNKPADIVIFTDGSSRGNPGPGGWGTVIVLVSEGRVVELSGYDANTTNNIMELTALSSGLCYLIKHHNTSSSIQVYTDSEYVAAGIVKWVPGWIRKGWKTMAGAPVANREIWQGLHDAWKQFSLIKITRVYGHVGVPGNERCDILATSRALREPVNEYDGSLASYPIKTILHIPDASEQSANRAAAPKSRTTKAAGAWYVSVIGGKVYRDQDWNTCKERVHGVSAKYKKVATAQDEAMALKSWGVK